MFWHIKCKYEDKNDINVHIDSFAQFFSPRSTTYDKDPSITTVFLNKFYSFFEVNEGIDFNIELFFEKFSIALVFTIMNIRIKPDYL